MSSQKTAPRSILAFNKWIEDAQTHLNPLRHTSTFEPSETLAVDALARASALQSIVAQHLVIVNTCRSTVLRLPRELLECIFLFAAANQHPAEWMTLGHVCSALRGVLLGLSSLWGASIYAWPDGLHRDELLERAGPLVPLTLKIPQDALDANEFAWEHMHRAQTVHAAHTGFIEKFVSNTDVPSLPYLERVHLQRTRGESIVTRNHALRDTPRLAEVTLCNVVWRFFPGNITRLIIIGFDALRILDDGPQLPHGYPALEFLDTLRQSSRLQTLHITRSLPFILDDAITSETVPLPCLRALFVQDTRERIIQFWRVLAVPPEARVTLELQCNLEEEDQQLYTGLSFFEDAAMFKNHLKGRTVSALHIATAFNLELRFIVFSLSSQQEIREADPEATLRLSYLGALGPATMPTNDRSLSDLRTKALLKCCVALGLLDVPRLSWDAHAQFGRGDCRHWVRLLMNFTALERLDFDYMDRTLWTALGCCIQSHSTLCIFAGPEQMLPRLYTLTVKKLEFFVEPWDEYEPGRFWDTNIFDTMRARAAVYPLRALKCQALHVISQAGDEDAAKEKFLAEFRARFPECQLEVS